MKKIFYTSDVRPKVGIPFPTEYFTVNRGEVISKMDESLTNKLFKTDPKKAELLASLLTNQKDLESTDPLEWGWALPMWQDVLDNWEKYKIQVLFGGNRSSKSTLASRIVVSLALLIPEADIRCFHVDDERSKSDQQRFIYEALPEEYKKLSSNRCNDYSLQYSQKNGFTGQKIVFPSKDKSKKGSTITFHTYAQYLRNPQKIEGIKSHFIWMDEEAPEKLFETVLPRLDDYRGKLMLTFTTLQGYTPLVTSILNKATTLKSRFSDKVNKDLPIEQESFNWPNCRIQYFWTEDNPFSTGDLFIDYKNKPIEYKLARWYGIPTKAAFNKFPRFNEHVNVVTTGDRIHKKFEKATHYHVADPAGGKNWFMIWACVNKEGDIYVYREWPDAMTYGPWGYPHVNGVGLPVGKPGPAQASFGYGFKYYAELIEKLEKDSAIFDRLIDPRLGTASFQSEETTTDITTEISNFGIYFQPAPGLDIEHGLQKINALLDWDDTKPLTEENRPKLYINRECGNIIEAIQEYTGYGGKNEAFKDPIDCLRYLVTHDPVYYDPSTDYKINRFGGY